MPCYLVAPEVSTTPRIFTYREGIKMTIVIFFGGLVAGFFIGWVGMALLTLSSVSNRQEEFEAMLYHELTQTHQGGG